MSEPTGKTVQVSWVQLENGHALRYRASDERITTSGDVDGNLIHSVPLPVKAQTRLDLARLVAPEGWSIAPSEQITNTASMLEDLGAILDALSLGNHGRPHSPHEVVQREVLPAIERMMYDAYRWRCADDSCETQQDIHFHDAEAQAAQPDRPEPVDPASVARAKAEALREGAAMIANPYTQSLLETAAKRYDREAEPEPDPANVEALYQVLYESHNGGGTGEPPDVRWCETYAHLAVKLDRRNVRVVSTDA